METDMTKEIDEKLKSHFIDLFSIALSDNEIDTKELELLYSIGKANGIAQEQIDIVIKNPHKVKTYIPENPIEKIERLYDFAKMVLADGKVDIREVEILKNFCKKFGFIEDNIPELIEFLIEESKKGTSKEEILNIVQQNL